MEAVSYHRLSRYKIRKIILCFTEDITASSVSKILPINRNTINAYYNEIRKKILQHSLKEQEKELGEFELDKSCFGVRRVREKKGKVQLAINSCTDCRVFRHENEFAHEVSHVNGIECFWSCAKCRFAKFKG